MSAPTLSSADEISELRAELATARVALAETQRRLAQVTKFRQGRVVLPFSTVIDCSSTPMGIPYIKQSGAGGVVTALPPCAGDGCNRRRASVY